MFGFYISLPFLIFALYRLNIVLYNYFTRPFLPEGTPKDNPLVSILVYVKNSENNIGHLIKGLSNQTHQNLEILIYNDQSSDKSVDIISELSAGDKRFRLFNGNYVSDGWYSKNYAYDKLIQLAQGQYYIFVNSEIIIDNQFVANAISHMQEKSLSLLTIFPKPQSQKFWVRMKISTAQWMFLSLNSIKSFLKRRREERSIFTNSLLIIEATTYNSNRWFDKFKDIGSPEDQIADDVKSLNLEYECLLGDNSLVREVADFNFEIIDPSAGLIKSKNRLIAYAIAITLGLFLAIFLLPFPLVFLYLFAIIYSQMLVALIFQQSVFTSLILLPVQFFVVTRLLVKALNKIRK